jgi:glycosyltransferase involved in cell wall biosynthesis
MTPDASDATGRRSAAEAGAGETIADDRRMAALVELAEARRQLTALRSSLAFRVGSLIVEVARTAKSPLVLARNLGSLGLTMWDFWATARIDKSLFVRLPPTEQPTIDLTSKKEVRRASRLARLTEHWKAGEATTRELERICAEGSADWLAPRARLAVEADAIARHGFNLPPKAARSSGEARKVFYVVDHDPLTANDGYTRRTHEIVSGLQTGGWDVQPISAPAVAAEVLDFRFNGVRYTRLMMQQGASVGIRTYIDAFAAQIVDRAKANRPALIHAASPFPNGLAAASAARVLGLPYLYEVRGLWELTRLVEHPEFRSSLGFAAQSRMECDATCAADRVLALGAELGQELTRRGLDSERWTVSASGAPEMTLATTALREDALRRFGLSDGFVIGYVGSLVRYEGLAAVLEAFARLAPRRPDAKLLIVGDGADRPRLEGLVRRFGISQRVVFAGRLAAADAKVAYQAIDLLLYVRERSILTETVPPLKHLEAAAAGLPIIVSDVAPLKRFADESGAAVIVPSQNADALAEAILALMDDPARRRELGGRGRAYTATRTWARTADGIAAAYAACLRM